MAKKLEITATDAVAESIKTNLFANVESAEFVAETIQQRVNQLEADLKAAREKLVNAKAVAKDCRDAYESAFGKETE